VLDDQVYLLNRFATPTDIERGVRQAVAYRRVLHVADDLLLARVSELSGRYGMRSIVRTRRDGVSAVWFVPVLITRSA